MPIAQSSQPRDTTPIVPAEDASSWPATIAPLRSASIRPCGRQREATQPGVFADQHLDRAGDALQRRGERHGDRHRDRLHFTLPLDRLNTAFDAVDLALTTPPEGADAGTFKLSLADSIWAQQDLVLSPTFLDALAVDYGAGVNLVDFEKAPEPARAAINGWVSDETQGEIPMLLPLGSIDAATRLVLANAVYFHGDWVTPFEAKSPNGALPRPGRRRDRADDVRHRNGRLERQRLDRGGLPYDGNTTAMYLLSRTRGPSPGSRRD